jgi:hypothetical protein
MENPLKTYLKTHSLKKSHKHCGLSENTLRANSRMTREEVMRIYLGNYLKIKKHLGVDLLDWKE